MLTYLSLEKSTSVRPRRHIEPVQLASFGEEEEWNSWDEQSQYCKKVLEAIGNHPDAWPFAVPVDPVGLQIPDYFDVIKQPIDFGTVGTRLAAGHYQDVDGFVCDVRLVFQNCYTYNQPGTDVVKMARRVEKAFDEKIAKLIRNRSKSGSKRRTDDAGKLVIKRAKSFTSKSATVTFAKQTKFKLSEGSDPIPFCRDIFRELTSKKNLADAWPFMEPVDPIKLGIPDYFDVIKHPMDFSLIKKRLDTGRYTSAAEFGADVRLMFANCYRYNPPDSDVYQMGKRLQEVFETSFAQLPEEIAFSTNKDNSATPSAKDERQLKIEELRKVLSSASRELESLQQAAAEEEAHILYETPLTLDEKEQLSNDINLLSGETLGQLVRLIRVRQEQHCRESEEVEIDIEHLDTRTLRDMQRLVEASLPKGGSRTRGPRPQSDARRRIKELETLMNVRSRHQYSKQMRF